MRLLTLFLLVATTLAGCGQSEDDAAQPNPAQEAMASPTPEASPQDEREQPGYARRASDACAKSASQLPKGALPDDEGALMVHVQRETAALLESAVALEELHKPKLRNVTDALRELAVTYQQIATPGIPQAAAREARARLDVVRGQLSLAAQDARVPTCALR